MKMTNAYAVLVVKPDSMDLYRICGSQEHALNTYRQITGKPGAYRATDPNAALPEDILEVDVTPESKGVIAKYSFELVEVFDA